jgi:uncharacterized protein (TIGR03032 family)
MSNSAEASPPAGEIIACAATDGFQEWMRTAGGVVAITTYQAGKVAMLGWNGAQASLLLRHFNKPLGLAVHGSRMALATRHEVLLLADAPMLAPEFAENDYGRYDSLFLPRTSYFTGDVNAHDVAFGVDGLWLVNTRFSCLAAVSHDYSFVPRWKPKFISQIAPEDRCHLNGVAMREGRPKYVTALGETDVVGGWRARKADGGIVVDVESGETIFRGLSMPHSPRLYDGALWVLNSGLGELWCIDPVHGTHGVVCALPGYLRGLCFVGPYALIGLCQIREQHIFGGLPVQSRFPKLQCGLAVVDLRSGSVVGFFEFTAGCTEVYEVAFIPGVQRPMILNSSQEESRQAMTAPEFSYWLRPSSLISDDSAEAGSREPL